ncbi:MAG: zinc dependent phospholipase C family protein [Eubacteriales bacterium]|nr:zinc dependent phospholipase C family protein [Eubacteriales bacterium]
MPAAYAHYLFGKEVFKKLPEKEKKIVREGNDAFLLGLHGPDLLFYYFPLCKNRINQQGTRMHEELAAGFFELGRERYRKDRDPALRAYLYGFLCHFMLDSECHPYISRYMEEKDLGHLEIETEFDRYLMVRNGIDPLRYVPIHHLISRARTRKAISGMFDRVSPGQIGISIRLFRRTLCLFTCRRPWKRKLLRALSHVTGQDKELGGLIMDGIPNLPCEESDLFLEDRLYRTAGPAAKEIEQYSRALDEGGILSVRLYRNYEEFGS